MSKERCRKLKPFKDLSLSHAEEHLVKAQLVYKIDAIMKARRLKQAEAAEVLGVKLRYLQDVAGRFPLGFEFS